MKWRLRPAAGPKPFDVVLFGENSTDFVGVLDGPTPTGGKAQLSSLAVYPGGQAATAALACARQGLRTRYVGAFQPSPGARSARGFGRLRQPVTDGVGSVLESGSADHTASGDVHSALVAGGVDVVACECPGASNRTAIILVNAISGERTVLEHRDPALMIGPERLPIEDLLSGRLLMLDATNLAAATAAARAARARGIPTVVDVDRLEPGTRDFLATIDVIVVPAPFLQALTGLPSLGEGLGRLESEFHPALAVVTLGAEGSLARVDGHEIRTPGFSVAVADTTGAGDAFRGGFMSAWLKLGESPDLEEILRFANATAALSCRAVGAQSGLPSFDDVRDLCRGSV